MGVIEVVDGVVEKTVVFVEEAVVKGVVAGVVSKGREVDAEVGVVSSIEELE